MNQTFEANEVSAPKAIQDGLDNNQNYQRETEHRLDSRSTEAPRVTFPLFHYS